ncbi:hypothetical protein CONLIGDRAFT_682080 [Coniochaeta ligniaria NRRL 30616]|uniref:Uncharacterized protein n=1 Tax=Coniochaeta ligniaria NRRL 30616 TaxID=1408157 RepID=A0A1J7IPQ3_9PEZI|nr:hypothetical protein CONLIGDRAFT_682080 [Coniochaeta ligniaria NRRL 30616]
MTVQQADHRLKLYHSLRPVLLLPLILPGALDRIEQGSVFPLPSMTLPPEKPSCSGNDASPDYYNSSHLNSSHLLPRLIKFLAPGQDTIAPSLLVSDGPAPPNYADNQVRHAAATGNLFQQINGLAIMRRDEDVLMGRASNTSPDYPNTRAKAKARALTPSPEHGVRLGNDMDDYISSALFAAQLQQMVHVDFVKKFRSCLNRKTRPQEDRVRKNRKPRDKTIGALAPAVAAKFAPLILRIASTGNDDKPAQPEQRRPFQQPARRSSALFNLASIFGADGSA